MNHSFLKHHRSWENVSFCGILTHYNETLDKRVIGMVGCKVGRG